MASYEALYGRKYRSLICWTELRDRVLLGLELVQTTTDKIKVIQQRLKIAHSRQKSYANVTTPIEYEVGDHVFIRVVPMKGQSRFSKKGKLSHCYIGSFQVLERLGPVAYRVGLPPGMGQMHNVFHVSMLWGYLRNLFHVINYHQTALDENMEYEEWLEQIIDRQVKQLRNKSIPMEKVEWKEHYEREATWVKYEMRQRYPHLFLNGSNISLEDQPS
ncbi:uncharacterized protein LOC114303008 [Camellia sinensis]|uniref:uncharacterized protein LOC114303008 n=1 Tax=Camellia sinensis TaxID=4442 RepID=UPI0010359584|nr:uncharacterized protein LOC114303008 [Camellia sinensis]